MLGPLIYLLKLLIWCTRTGLRRFRKAPHCVIFVLEGSYPELPPRRETLWQRLLGPAPRSLRDLTLDFRAVAQDQRIEGVVLHLRALGLPMGQLQTLRDLVEELRQSGKRVIAWASHYDSARYYLACAADEILLQPGGAVDPLGLRQSFIFLGNALKRIGVEADFLQISPYKSGIDPLMRAEMSEEMRDMVNWLADDAYQQWLDGIRQGRDCNRAEAQAWVDHSPYTDLQAIEAGVVDGTLNEEDLPSYLGADGRPARLSQWEQARKLVAPRPPARPGRYVAVLRIEGDIVDGRSKRPPRKSPTPIPFLLNERAGDLTVVQEARRALSDRRAAAVVVYIDSGGGSAAASEAITAALHEIASDKPLVAAFGPTAASGGYYVASPAHRVIAQAGTITGSIGVLHGKIVGAGLLENLRLNRETLTRGQRTKLYDPGRPFTEEERELIWQYIQRVYAIFLERVSSGRKLSREEIDAVGRGRVWTGRQAMERGLIDEQGGFDLALERARELAGLSDRAPVREVTIPTARTLLAPTPRAGDWMSYMLEGLALFRQARALCLAPLIIGIDEPS